MKIVVFIVSRLWQKVYYLFRQQVRNVTVRYLGWWTDGYNMLPIWEINDILWLRSRYYKLYYDKKSLGCIRDDIV